MREAVFDIMRFWLNKGANGFRMDVINFISKDQRFPDAPIKDPRTPWQWGDKWYANGPRLHEYLQAVGKILKEYDTFSVGEMPFVTDTNEVLQAVRYDRNEINMIFNFEHVDIDHGRYDKFEPGSWKLTDLKAFFERWQTFMYENDGWNALYWENHDQPRCVDRYVNASEEHRVQAAKMLAAVLALMSGSPFVYQGQEIGMSNVPKEWGMEEYKDIDCLNHWHRYILSFFLFPHHNPTNKPKPPQIPPQRHRRPRIRPKGIPEEIARQRPHTRAMERRAQRRLHLAHRQALDDREPELHAHQRRSSRQGSPLGLPFLGRGAGSPEEVSGCVRLRELQACGR